MLSPRLSQRRENTVVQAIHTAVPGRVRYKVAGLYHSQSLKRLIEERLAEKKGIHSVSAEPLTGKVLVSFNSDNTPATVAVLLEQIVAEHNGHGLTLRETGPARDRKQANDRGPQQKRASATSASLSQQERLPAKSSVLPSFLARTEEQKSAPWHLMDESAVLATLHSSKASGLSTATAAHNLEMYGPNLLPEAKPRSGLSMFLEQFHSLPVGLLAAAAGISLFTGGLADAVVIMGVV